MQSLAGTIHSNGNGDAARPADPPIPGIWPIRRPIRIFPFALATSRSTPIRLRRERRVSGPFSAVPMLRRTGRRTRD